MPLSSQTGSCGGQGTPGTHGLAPWGSAAPLRLPCRGWGTSDLGTVVFNIAAPVSVPSCPHCDALWAKYFLQRLARALQADGPRLKTPTALLEPNVISCHTYSAANKILNTFWHPGINTESYRTVGVGRDLCGSPSPTPCQSRVTQSRLHRTLSRLKLLVRRISPSLAPCAPHALHRCGAAQSEGLVAGPWRGAVSGAQVLYGGCYMRERT